MQISTHRGLFFFLGSRANLSRVLSLLAVAAAPALGQVQGQSKGPVSRVRVHLSGLTGLATFVTPDGGEAIAVPSAVQAAEALPGDFIDQYGPLFGVSDRAKELQQQAARKDSIGFTHTRFDQVYDGVPVFGGVVKVHQNAAGAVTSASGHFFPIPAKVRATPTLGEDLATGIAVGVLEHGDPIVEKQELVIVDPGWYGDPPTGPRLAYHIILADVVAVIREAFFVDAHSGEILDQWSMIHSARDRQIHDGMGGPAYPGTLVRAEGDPPVGAPADVDRAYDYYGDTYDYYSRAFGRDSIDGLGLPMVATVNSTAPSCPNAFWDGSQMVFCLGTVTDDVVAHELTHGVTQYTSGLIYQNQPGQLNEAFSDIFGELVDLFNGNAAFAGAPAGPPFWPAHPTGPGLDTPNNLRTGACSVSGHHVQVTSPSDISAFYRGGTASFGPALTFAGVTGNVVAVVPALACNADLPLNNAMINGNIALIDRGSCPFTEKVKNAQNAGAIAVIMVNSTRNSGAMTGMDPTITIPSLMIGGSDGNFFIKARLAEGPVTATLRNLGIAYDDGVRWVVGEDATSFGGAIRDMWHPSCLVDPDSASHVFEVCDPRDNGGVHSGSGVANHAFALMTDGGTFNGYTPAGIGPIKSGAVWYRAQTTYLSPFSDFQDAYLALTLAAGDLVGSTPADPRTGGPSASAFTAANVTGVDDALRAVGMDTDGACGSTLNAAAPTTCAGRQTLLADDFESGVGGWTVSHTVAPTEYDWVQVSSLPLGRAGTAWFIDDPSIGNCNTIDESALHTLFSPAIGLPAALSNPVISFAHYFWTEAGFDGGNISVRVNAGSWQLVPKTAIVYNPYTTSLVSAAGNTSPLAGQAAWTGPAGNWGTTLVDLSTLVTGGETLEVRFDFGKDGCTGNDGWYVDDFEVFHCPCAGVVYGDVYPLGGNGIVDLDDILCVLDDFADSDTCEGDGDIKGGGGTPCEPNGVIDLDDILAVLDAFGGIYACSPPCR